MWYESLTQTNTYLLQRYNIASKEFCPEGIKFTKDVLIRRWQFRNPGKSTLHFRGFKKFHRKSMNFRTEFLILFILSFLTKIFNFRETLAKILENMKILLPFIEELGGRRYSCIL